jgi:predicted permease
MHSFAILVSCFALGMLLRRSGRMPETAAASLNGFIVHVSLPALTLHTLRHLSLDASMAAPLVMAWLLFAAGTGFFFLAQRTFGWGAPTTGALILTGALGNTSFVGLPMIECFFGREHLGIGILIDQLGTYVVLSTVGLLLAATLSAGELTLRVIARRILCFPPFLAVLLAFATAPLALPQWVEAALARLGDTLAPLALFSVGYQLRLGALRSRWRPLAAGLGYKLVAGPLLVLLVITSIWGLDGPAARIAVFEAAMAPMIGGAIVAVEHKLDAELATLMLGIGIPLSFLTLPIWSMVLTA